MIAEIPIVAVSAFVGQKEIDKCIGIGMSDYSKILVLSL